jgi:hypothetical protein
LIWEKTLGKDLMANAPALKGQPDKDRIKLLDILQKSMDGKVISKVKSSFLKINKVSLNLHC